MFGALLLTCCSQRVESRQTDVQMPRLSEVLSSGTDESLKREMLELVRKKWQAYLSMDREALQNLLAPGAIRASQRTRRIQRGRASILKELPAEWEAFERPGGRIAEHITIRKMRILPGKSGEAALVTCWMEMEGGARWKYDDQAFAALLATREGSAWRILFWTDALNLDYNLDEEQPGDSPAFDFDYVYPAQNLKRAVAFYAPILGTPEFQNSTRAIFLLEGARFIVTTDTLNGVAAVRSGKPNGFAAIHAADLPRRRSRLEKQGVEFLLGTKKQDINWAGRPALVTRDLEGNVIAFTGRPENTGSYSRVSGLDSDDVALDPARQIARAWVESAPEKIASLMTENAEWLDSTKVKFRGAETRKSFPAAFRKYYTTSYADAHGKLGVDWHANAMQKLSVDGLTAIVYLRELSNSTVREKALVTHFLNPNAQVETAVIFEANVSPAMAVALDYAGHPVLKLGNSSAFYEERLELGKPYKDESWRGFWGNDAVLGIFESEEKDKILEQNRANGYISFWVRSADRLYEYLQKQGAKFPRIPSINNKSGIESHPGYRQVVATDSEGNVVVFTEYTGRRR